jgi:hypothetical protein
MTFDHDLCKPQSNEQQNQAVSWFLLPVCQLFLFIVSIFIAERKDFLYRFPCKFCKTFYSFACN